MDIYSMKSIGERSRLAPKLIADLSGVDRGYVRRFLASWTERGYLVRYAAGDVKFAHNGRASSLYGIGQAGRDLLRTTRDKYLDAWTQEERQRWSDMGSPDITGFRAKRQALESQRVPVRYVTKQQPDGGILHVPVRGDSNR